MKISLLLLVLSTGSSFGLAAEQPIYVGNNVFEAACAVSSDYAKNLTAIKSAVKQDSPEAYAAIAASSKTNEIFSEFRFRGALANSNARNVNYRFSASYLNAKGWTCLTELDIDANDCGYGITHTFSVSAENKCFDPSDD
jgi:hypothetical protein